jgi:phosphate starvation-inducible PhoH-like protein
MPELSPGGAKLTLQKEFVKVGIDLSLTPNQIKLVESIRKNTLTFAYGSAGTGKTFVTLMEAARIILAEKKKRIDRIILIRPAVAAQEKLGFLPGELHDKIDPYLTAFYQNLDKLPAAAYHEVKSCIDNETIAFLRGTTFEKCFVIVDEAQNVNKSQMKLILTRIGRGAKMVICGDTNQVDIAAKDSGLSDAIGKLRGIPKAGFVKLTSKDIMRSGIVKDILERYEGLDEESDKSELSMDVIFPIEFAAVELPVDKEKLDEPEIFDLEKEEIESADDIINSLDNEKDNNDYSTREAK